MSEQAAFAPQEIENAERSDRGKNTLKEQQHVDIPGKHEISSIDYTACLGHVYDDIWRCEALGCCLLIEIHGDFY